jgi:hypothetical protein
MLAENDEDVKTVQSHMRHANSNITMNNYTHAVSSKKRRAQTKVVENPAAGRTAERTGGRLTCIFCVPRHFSGRCLSRRDLNPRPLP